MKGSYILLLELSNKKDIVVGRLGCISFPEAVYAYVGSAMNGFKARLAHHLREKERPYWHIDYLLEEVELVDIILCPSRQRTECSLSQALAAEFHAIPGFGSSDCKCNSHLYFGDGRDRPKEKIMKAIDKAGLTCRSYRRRN